MESPFFTFSKFIEYFNRLFQLESSFEFEYSTKITECHTIEELSDLKKEIDLAFNILSKIGKSDLSSTTKRREREFLMTDYTNLLNVLLKKTIDLKSDEVENTVRNPITTIRSPSKECQKSPIDSISTADSESLPESQKRGYWTK